MTGVKTRLKSILPVSVRRRLSKYYSWIHYEEYDTSDGWRRNASKKGWQAIYWHNEVYNECYDREQKRLIRRFLEENQIERNEPILDIGCGIGRLCKFFVDLGYEQVTGVDFPEMIEVANSETSPRRIQYIGSSAQDFSSDKRFGFIISSGCFASIRKHDFMYKAINNCIRMQSEGDHLLMIDPFHKNNYLAISRARISPDDIIEHMNKEGYELIMKSGMLFLPMKKVLANRWHMKETTTVRLYYLGEKILRFLSAYYWSDYKVLGFRRQL